MNLMSCIWIQQGGNDKLLMNAQNLKSKFH
jgi:hypothetical protein